MLQGIICSPSQQWVYRYNLSLLDSDWQGCFQAFLKCVLALFLLLLAMVPRFCFNTTENRQKWREEGIQPRKWLFSCLVSNSETEGAFKVSQWLTARRGMQRTESTFWIWLGPAVQLRAALHCPRLHGILAGGKSSFSFLLSSWFFRWRHYLFVHKLGSINHSPHGLPALAARDSYFCEISLKMNCSFKESAKSTHSQSAG